MIFTFWSSCCDCRQHAPSWRRWIGIVWRRRIRLWPGMTPSNSSLPENSTQTKPWNSFKTTARPGVAPIVVSNDSLTCDKCRKPNTVKPRNSASQGTSHNYALYKGCYYCQLKYNYDNASWDQNFYALSAGALKQCYTVIKGQFLSL